MISGKQALTAIALFLVVFILLLSVAFAGFMAFQKIFPAPQKEITIKDKQEEQPSAITPEKKLCPFGCCSGLTIYLEKKCTAPFKCVNNECTPIACPNECCHNLAGYQEKACASGQECVGNACLKPECPNICCMKSDPDYREKKCAVGGLRCVGRVCTVSG